MPVTSLASALVYQASGEEVDTVLVDGRVLMRERVVLTVDEPSLRARAQRAATGVLRRSGLLPPFPTPG
jgi:5-methylthioadenosine/S-adenosylhomocysteine deaminase